MAQELGWGWVFPKHMWGQPELPLGTRQDVLECVPKGSSWPITEAAQLPTIANTLLGIWLFLFDCL